MPIYELREGTVNALRFNHVQVALKRIGDSIRYPTPKLKHLDLILERTLEAMYLALGEELTELEAVVPVE